MIRFGTGGFRGVIGEDFDKANVQLIAQGLAEVSRAEKNDKPVAVGYDYRFISDRAAVWVSEVLAANGIRVLLFDGAMPTPAIMYAVKENELNYGVMITASHNPYYFNGVKLFLKGGVDADVNFTQRLEKVIDGISEVKTVPLESAKSSGLVQMYNDIDSYLGFIRKFISPGIVNNTAKILYDNLNGVGAVCLTKLAEKLNIKQFDVRNSGHDAFFGFSLPNPTREMMEPLSGIVRREGYDFAIATDSDGDRLGIIDEQGRYVDSNTILGALYYYLCRYRGEKGDVVKNCATSLLLDKLAAKLGYKCHEVDVGFKNISRKMAETDALIGGESSGGLTVRGYIKGKDSVFSSALFMEMVIMMKKPVSEIVREVYDFAEYSLDADEKTLSLSGFDGVEKYLTENAPALSEKVLEIKHFGRNYKYILKNGWALLRMSGTEPAIRIFAETDSREQTDKIIGEIIDDLKKYA